MALLQVQDISISIDRPEGKVGLVRDVSFDIQPGEIVGMLGESGCGKSLTALAILGLLPEGMTATGEILFKGANLLTLDEPSLCRLRGNRIGLIFQEPMTTLNPMMTIGDQVMEPLRLHRGLGRHDARAEALRLLERIRLPSPRQKFDSYPHQLSGGQRQRVVIAMAIACKPELLIADEPTTALDTTMQMQILDLLLDLTDETDTGLLLITHDLGVMAEMTDRILVMYGGSIVETSPTADLIASPAHPYSRGLLRAIPQRAPGSDGWLEPIPGTVPAPAARPQGCLFRARCPIAIAECAAHRPELRDILPGRSAACWAPTIRGQAGDA